MANWTHTYREGQIPPNGTITETRPGHTIAKAISEIQEKALTDVAPIETSGNIEADVNVSEGVVQIRLSVPDSGDAGDTLPTSGEDGMYLRYSPDGNHYWDYIRAVELP